VADTVPSQPERRLDLVLRMNRPCQQAFKQAGDAARRRGNPYVELVHFVEQLVGIDGGDVGLMLGAAGIDPSEVQRDVTRALDGLATGGTSIETFADPLFQSMKAAWSLGSLTFGTERVRSGHILIACRQEGVLSALLEQASPAFRRIDPETMLRRFAEVTADSVEETAAPEAAPPPAAAAESALARYAVDLTARARAQGIDPVIGRDPEIRQIVDILMRRRQNNPILTGEAGVGKTAVVEGFALRIAAGDVPPPLAGVRLHMLDVGLMQAGASVKGEFERRLRAVIDEVQASPVPVILFIDEAHTLIGAGGAAGTGDAANLLKPALARGELRTIAATTWSEYKQHIEKDPALTRRFQVVRVEEPDEAVAVQMLRGVAGTLEKHHSVQIFDEAITAAVALSRRFIPARQLPDKAVSLLDTACARVAVSQHSTPAEVEHLRRRQETLGVEREILGREAAIGLDVDERLAKVAARAASTATALAEAEARWAQERALVAQILELRARLRTAPAAREPALAGEDAPPPETDRQADLDSLRGLMATLADRQGEMPLILPSVDRNAVAAVVQDWTGIPTGRMLTSQTEKALHLAASLGERVVGQDHAMEMIARRVQTNRAGLGAPEKPVGVFLLCGPSGVGKTETALALAETLYGGEQNLITINMSEFQEAHTVSLLKGAPPGYVGYGKGGVLTEAVRRKPWSVLLLDEVEKAHPDVHEIFFQVFDKGMMDDSEGRRIDFKNCLILLTSNVGSEVIMALTESGRKRGPIEALDAALRRPLLEVFPAAFLGRVVTVPYYPLGAAMIDAITRARLGRIARQLAEAHGAALVVGDGVVELVRDRCTALESGGRMIDAILTNTLLPELSRGVLECALRGERPSRIVMGTDSAGFTYAFE